MTAPQIARWGATALATLVSTYALDAFATAAGLLLVGCGLLAGLDRDMALAFVAGSYLIWALGLRSALAANWTLLTTTGTSSNLLSKLAHDLTWRYTASLRARRFASATGYVGTEVIKEVPYYAGAFGAVLVSDSVSAGEAIIFLGGANLGAAAYEYGLAGVTTALLHRRYASFEADWVPREYLADYYRTVEPDELETIAFFVEALRESEPDRPVLFFGVGPTLHHVFLAARTASEIHLGDYLPANLAEIQRWIDGADDAHDWRPFIRYTLQCEGLAAPTEADLSRRAELTRRKITKLVQVDARDPRPLPGRYSTVISAYCADSATDDRGTWQTYMRHITGLVLPGGIFITAALRRSSGYLVGGKAFPSARVDEDDLRAVLPGAPGPLDGSIQVRNLHEQAAHGYSGIVLGWVRVAA